MENSKVFFGHIDEIFVLKEKFEWEKEEYKDYVDFHFGVKAVFLDEFIGHNITKRFHNVISSEMVNTNFFIKEISNISFI